jgi:RND family efflux transporter MFP subunit
MTERSLLLLSLPLAFVLSGCRHAAPKADDPPPPEVEVSTPIAGEITETREFTGHTESVKTIVVRARVSGYLDKVLFKEGAEVQRGDLLFEIDRRTYNAEYDRAVANLAQARAHLTHMEANYTRAKNLIGTHAISQSDFDQAVGDLGVGKAAVKVAEAALHAADLNLDFTRVTAPISGRISRQMIDPGNLVKADDTPLTTIISLDPMYAVFDIDERVMQQLARAGKLKSSQDGIAKVELGLADEIGYPHSGTLNFIDNQEDLSTGTLRLRGVFPNPDRLLSPNMFVRIRVPVGDRQRLLLVKEQAVGSDQGKKFLYVLDENDVVQRRNIEVGSAQDGLYVVRSGLKAAERVVVNGLQRVRVAKKVAPKSIAMAVKDSTAASVETRAVSGSAPVIPGDAGGLSPAPRGNLLPPAQSKPSDESRPGVKAAASASNHVTS